MRIPSEPWLCFNCGKQNMRGYGVCWNCSQTYEESAAVYAEMRRERADPRPVRMGWDKQQLDSSVKMSFFGKQGSGKTTLMNHIASALDDYDYKYEVYDDRHEIIVDVQPEPRAPRPPGPLHPLGTPATVAREEAAKDSTVIFASERGEPVPIRKPISSTRQEREPVTVHPRWLDGTPMSLKSRTPRVLARWRWKGFEKRIEWTPNLPPKLTFKVRGSHIAMALWLWALIGLAVAIMLAYFRHHH